MTTRTPVGAAPASTLTIGYSEVLADDGTRLRAWTNDPQGVIDGPVVLLCNGLGTNPWAWPAFLDPACGVRVVSWNHRGTSGSERPDDRDRVGIDDFVRDALSVLDHFGIDRAVAMGWSMGVNTAFELAAQHPERVVGIFAVAGVPGDTFRTMLAPLRVPHWLARQLTINLTRAGRELGVVLHPFTSRLPIGRTAIGLLTHSGFMRPVPDPALAARMLAEFLTTPPGWYFHLALKTSEHARVSLSGIGVPALMVAARWDILAGARDMHTAAQRLPRGEYAELRGTHFVHMERPEAVHELLRDFLDRVLGAERDAR